MSNSDIEFGTCDFCKEEKSLERTYIHGCDQVDGKCDGFIIIHHCSDCQPREIQHLTEENKRLEQKYNDLIERARAAFRTFWFSRSVTWHDLSNVKKIESDIFQDELNQP